MERIGEGRAWNDPIPFGITLRPKIQDEQAGDRRLQPSCRGRLVFEEDNARNTRPSEEGCVGCTCGMLRAVCSAAADGLHVAVQMLTDRHGACRRCEAPLRSALGSCFALGAAIPNYPYMAYGDVYGGASIESPTVSFAGLAGHGGIAMQSLTAPPSDIPCRSHGHDLYDHWRMREYEHGAFPDVGTTATPDGQRQGRPSGLPDYTVVAIRGKDSSSSSNSGSKSCGSGTIITPGDRSASVSEAGSAQPRRPTPRSASCSIPRSADSCSTGSGSDYCSPSGPTPALSLSTANSFSSGGSRGGSSSGGSGIAGRVLFPSTPHASQLHTASASAASAKAAGSAPRCGGPTAAAAGSKAARPALAAAAASVDRCPESAFNEVIATSSAVDTVAVSAGATAAASADAYTGGEPVVNREGLSKGYTRFEQGLCGGEQRDDDVPLLLQPPPFATCTR